MLDDKTLFNRAQAYVGTPYIAGQFDCTDLAVQVQRELFNLAVPMPSHSARPGSVARAGGAAIHRLREALADPVETPHAGDFCLLWAPEGDEARGVQRWHVGTVFMHGGEIWVLHNSGSTTGAALQRLADIKRLGLRLDGFYRWRPAA